MVLDSANKTSTDPPLMEGEEQIVYPPKGEEENEKSGSCKSRMQEILLSENRWQENIHKLEEIIVSRGMHIFNQDSFCGVLKQENSLDILFKLFDLDDTGRIKQQKFVDQARYGLKQKPSSREWVELVDVLAFVICGEDEDITEENFHKIFLSKGVLPKLYKFTEKNNEGCTTKKGIMDLIANLTSARPREGFNKESLDHLERMFRESLGEKQELTFEDFKKIVHSRNPFFAERVFRVFDRDKNGSVSLSEFLDSMHQFTGKSPNDKIQFLFRIYDLDGDGLIRRDELEKVMKACMEENGMKFSNEQIEDLTLALFEDADTENRGEITFEDLKAQLEKHPGLLENLSISIDRWLLPPQPQKKKKFALPYQLTKPYFRNNYVYVIFLLCFTVINLGMFFSRLRLVLTDPGFQSLHATRNGFYAVARACGFALNFNCMFILFMVLRYSLTFLRSKGFSSYLPLDQNIYFHKLCGFVILVLSVLHTLMHLINFPAYVVYELVLTGGKEYTTAEWFFTSKPGLFGLQPGWANPTGFLLMIILTIMVICSLPFVRKSGKFEVFYWTHLLYILFFILTILHAPNFYKWFIAPGVIFIIEKVYRAVKMTYSKSYISSGILLPSKVTHLVVQKPPGFHFHPGDYVFVNIPQIAKYEWHPITISSAPEQEEAVWLHIRAVGEWTNRLYEYFEKQQKMCTKSHIHMARSKDETRIMIEDAKLTTHNEEDSKNGIVNQSYDSDGEEKNETSSSEHSDDGEKGPVKPARSKRNVDKSKSNPGFGIQAKRKNNLLMARNNFRTNSDKSFERKMTFATNRAAMQSFKYMRRKPKIVTLDMPEDIPIEGDEDESQKVKTNEEEIISKNGPKNTIVRLTSGRVFRSSKHKKEVSLDSRRARRQSRMKEAESIGTCSVGQPLTIYFDGAYGAPSSHIFRAQHAVLIGTGIGVTPFASILQSIMHRYLKTRQTCPNCAHTWSSEMPMSVMNLKKVDFYWINRDQRSFEWFVNLLSQLEIEQAEQGGALERFLDMHMYITSALQKTDMKAVGLQLAMDLLHEKEKRDLITGLKTRTNAGRPNWDKVFKQLRNQQKGKITVFYCGPPALGRILKYKCGDYGFDFRKENF